MQQVLINPKRKELTRIYKLNSDGNFEFIGYTSKEKDSGTGLNYYGARYYDSYSRHFTQADSVIADVYNPQSLNRYSYVLNNPYKYVDPSGEWAVQVGISPAIGIIPFASYGSIGLVYAYNPETKKSEFGFYSSIAPVGVSAPVGEVDISLELGITPEATKISDISGQSKSIGTSFGEGFVGGYEYSKSLDSDISSHTIQVGAGIAAEAHVSQRYTTTYSLQEAAANIYDVQKQIEKSSLFSQILNRVFSLFEGEEK